MRCQTGAAAAIAFGVLAVAAAAQTPPPILVLLRDPSGGSVAGATGQLVRRPQSELVALGELPRRGSLLASLPPLPAPLLGRGNDRGELRFVAAAPAGKGAPTAGGAGSGLVTTPSGLGALVVDLLPGRAQRLELRPLAAISTNTGSEEFTLFARAALPNGKTLPLGPFTGTEVRLPEGSYEVWAHADDGWTWQRLNLVSGQRSHLRFDGAGQRLRCKPETYVHPAGCPEVDLFAAGNETLLRGAALAAPLVAIGNGRWFAPAVIPGPPSPQVLPWPPDAEGEPRQPFLLAPPPSHDATPALPMTLVSLQRRTGDAWHVLGISPGTAGRFDLPVPPPGDNWLLFVAKGHAPQAFAWPTHGVPLRLDPLAGAPLTIAVQAESGLAIANVAVDYTPDGMDAAIVRGHTDDRGIARLGAVLAPGVLRLSDAVCANQAVHLDSIPGDPVKVTATAGLELRGTVQWPDGKPARAVLVTLRDPSNRLRPATRALVTDDDGLFLFAGLPEATPLVLFATTRRDGHTWSARLQNGSAGGDPIELHLRDEDPELGPPRGR